MTDTNNTENNSENKTKFSDLGIAENILNSITKIGFIHPTPIQEQAIPVAIKGHDILGSAQTGTGKTASFVLPMLGHLLSNYESTALILLPTRELAQQVVEATRQMMGNVNHLKIALIIGGESIVKQLQTLKRRPRIIVGTPGRINDHLKRKSLKLDYTDYLVLDETDRMLDMGFGIQLDEIAKYLPEQRQTLMFSATMPKNIMALSKKYLNNPVRIAIGDVNAVAQNVKQELVKVNEATKYPELVNQITTREGSTLIFVKTKFGADRLATRLNGDKLSADAIHGDLKQAKRQNVITGFRNQKFKVLVATDIAARGLDISHIENVINYDLPQCPEDYIHRIGRTARAGAKGVAINFLTSKDGAKWKEIHKLLNPSNKEKAYITGSPLDINPLNAGNDFFEPTSEAGKKSRRPRTAGAFGKSRSRSGARGEGKSFRGGKFNKNSKSFNSTARGSRKPKAK
ncbi:MAG: DEAD/DEAH box helicase [Alphaproteobacteria bacterium]